MIKDLIVKCMSFLPLKNTIIFESNPDFSDNTYWLFKYLVEEKHIQDSYKLVWFMADISKRRDSLCGAPIICVDHTDDSIKNLFVKLYYLMTAKIIIDCNRFVHKRKKEQVRIHLTHGMPIKNCDIYLKGLGECDVLTVMSDSFIPMFSSYVNPKNIYSFGLCRNEVLCENHPAKGFIFWMPTYRQHKKDTGNNVGTAKFPLGIPILKSEKELGELDAYLEEKNMKLLLRMHPAQDLSFFKVEKHKNIIIADDDFLQQYNIQLYELLSYSDALITDYSSVYYDYLLINRPIGLTIEDEEEYRKEYGLLYGDLKEELPGYYIDTISDLKDFINFNETSRKELKSFGEKFKIEPFESCEIIYKYIKSKL